MRLRLDQFCFLATAPAWLAWLYELSSPLYVEFVEHLRRKPSCRANSDKMLEMLHKITALNNGEDELETFLRHTFPHVLIDDRPIPARSRPQPRGPVFPHYDPNLITIPRRRVLTGQDGIAKLEQVVVSFLADKVESDFVIVDGVAYIEYLPRELEYLIGRVPETNWLVRRYRQANQLA
jgi:hypothetical protein